MFIIWVNQRRRKEEITLSRSSLQDSKSEREEHLFSTQLISQERNPATEINHFEGSRPEWLVPKGTSFFVFGKGKILRGGKGNNLLKHACETNSLFLFSFLSLFFHFFSYLSFFFLSFFFFFSLLVFISWFPSSQFYPPSSPSIVFFFSLYTARAPFYSACRE